MRVARRRRSSSGDAVVAMVVAAAIAVALFGAYLIVVGAIALVGWLAAVAARRATPGSPPRLAEAAATAPSATAPPASVHRELVPVEPGALDDPRRLEEAATDVFRAWARQLPRAPRDPAGVLRGLTLRRRLIGRLATQLDGRRFVRRTAPYTERDRFAGPAPLDPATLDPATLDAYAPPSDLRTRSRYVAPCRGCAGSGRLECTACGGAAQVPCAACAGAGKVPGVTASGARRLLNCKACRGKARVRCEVCARGRVDCPACARSGRIVHWLEVEGGPRDGDVQVEPDGAVTRAFRWGQDGVRATDDEIGRDARVVCAVSRDRPLTAEDLPPEVPEEWRRAHWQGIQARLQPGERVVSQTFSLLEVPAVEATYVVGSESQSIELEGRRLLAPPVSADALFHARDAALRRLAVALGAVPVIAGLVYAVRGSYFHSAVALAAVVCTAVAAAVVYGVFWHATLWGGARRWLAIAVPPIAAAVALAVAAEPSTAAARGYLERGQLALAEAELEALGGTGDGALAPLWAEVHGRRALAAGTCAAASALADQLDASQPQRAAARVHADALAVAEAERALEAGRAEPAAAALACASEATRAGATGRRVRVRIHSLEANRCLAARDWACVLARAADAERDGDAGVARSLGAAVRDAVRDEVDAAVAAARTERDLARRAALRAGAVELWSRYLLPEGGEGGEPAALSALRAAAASDQLALERANEAARRRQLAEEQRRVAAEARRREAEERRARQSEPRGVRCCDGTLSPTCLCGGRLRGCCSHHGGVCGCE